MAYQKQVPTAEQPVYVIGSEVPTPGGSGEEDALSVTKPEALVEMLTVFQDAFSQGGISEAYERVVAAVVQPGVEFGNDTVHEYVPQEAASLIRQAKSLPDIVLEGHSTDYQPEECLKQMVEDGVAILKVGPALTYAAREALFALSYIEKELEVPHPARFMETLEEVMLDAPASWSGHYPATEPAARQLRRFSYSDRSRYYMANQRVEAAIQQLLRNLREQPIPLIMLSQFLPNQYTHIRQGSLINDPEAIVLDRVRDTLRIYWRACGI